MVEDTNFSSGDKTVALHYFENCCAYCGQELNFTQGFPNSIEWEHVESIFAQQANGPFMVIQGGVKNRVPSCRTCNRKKSNKNVETFVKENFDQPHQILDNIEFYFALQEEFLFL